MVNFHIRIPHCDSQRLELFISSNPRICPTGTLRRLGKSDHVAISVSTDLSSNSNRDTPFHCRTYDKFCTDTDDRRDYLTDFPWKDIFKPVFSAPVTEFCEWVQVVIDVYISHCKYQIKHHLSP